MECEHGQLARACNICEYEREIEELKEEINRLKEEIKHLNPCGHTGFESVSCEVCGYPDSQKLIAKLKEAVTSWIKIAGENQKSASLSCAYAADKDKEIAALKAEIDRLNSTAYTLQRIQELKAGIARLKEENAALRAKLVSNRGCVGYTIEMETEVKKLRTELSTITGLINDNERAEKVAGAAINVDYELGRKDGINDYRKMFREEMTKC